MNRIEHKTLSGILHRLDGPAVIYPDGSFTFYKNGLKHNINGPAVVRVKGLLAYWVLFQKEKTYDVRFPFKEIEGIEFWIEGKRVKPFSCTNKDQEKFL